MENNKQRNSDFIARHWEILAASAWREYKVHGRGALVVGAFGEPDESIYLPQEMMAADPLLRDFARFADVYDPLQEIVIVFLGTRPSVTALKGGIPERGTPPELYERLKGVLQEH